MATTTPNNNQTAICQLWGVGNHRRVVNVYPMDVRTCVGMQVIVTSFLLQLNVTGYTLTAPTRPS